MWGVEFRVYMMNARQSRDRDSVGRNPAEAGAQMWGSEFGVWGSEFGESGGASRQ